MSDLPHRSLRNLSKKYGPIMHLRLGNISTIVISSSEMAKEIMKTQDLHFVDRPQIMSTSIIFYDCTDIGFTSYYVKSIIFYDCTDIGFTSYGDYWRNMRKDMFLAGTETASTTLIWAFLELIKNPRVMEKAQLEVRQRLNEKKTFNDTDVTPQIRM
uniref:Cytochrome P450 71D6 n=1 Tax=Solanum tuberosum TaxID=4113 RepID=M1AL84_SOLTU